MYNIYASARGLIEDDARVGEGLSGLVFVCINVFIVILFNSIIVERR